MLLAFFLKWIQMFSFNVKIIYILQRAFLKDLIKVVEIGDHLFFTSSICIDGGAINILQRAFLKVDLIKAKKLKLVTIIFKEGFLLL